MKKLIIISTGAALCLVVAFFILRETSVYNFAKMGWEHRRLDNARAKWEEHGFTSYVMDVKAADHGCYFHFNVAHKILVVDDRIVSTHPTDSPEIESGPSRCQNYTVTEVFHDIDIAVSARDTVRVVYNEELGYPTKFVWEYGGIDYAFIWESERLMPDLDTYADQQKREELIARTP